MLDESFWKNVIFCDQYKFNLIGSDDKVIVWHKPNQEPKPENLKATVKHGGGSIMYGAVFQQNSVFLSLRKTETSI